MTISAPPAPRQHHRKHPAPVLRVTFYDRVSSFLMAAVVGLILTVIVIIAVLPAIRPETSTSEIPPVGVVPGGFEQGAPEETLQVDSPESPIPNAAMLNDDVVEEPVETTLETVMELAESATRQFEQTMSSSTIMEGVPGSSVGTGPSPLGFDREGEGNEQRWYVLFDRAVSVDEYARQLEFFGIEPAALFQGRGELVYLSNLTDASPAARVVTTSDDGRLYMNWQGGNRRLVDVELFERAGVDASGALLLHFYPERTEQLLSRLEREFANQPVDRIRRTYFVVVKHGNGYSFAVTRQTYAR